MSSQQYYASGTKREAGLELVGGALDGHEAGTSDRFTGGYSHDMMCRSSIGEVKPGYGIWDMG